MSYRHFSLRLDHPRSRGVYSTAPRTARGSPGSSPLARGLLVTLKGGPVNSRIIPARAGFTVLPSPGLQRPAGSSPLARGLRLRLSTRPHRGWIIPARAGFTFLPARALECPAGSSPLARGLLVDFIGPLGGDRIIPARAGFTTTMRDPTPCATDHPRSRGVYEIYGYEPMASIGSSPLARGLRFGPNTCPTSYRIIPARAGFTRRRPPMRRRGPDHPRSRGVYAG